MDIDNIPVNSVRQAFPCGRLDSSISKSISIKRRVRDHRTALWHSEITIIIVYFS